MPITPVECMAIGMRHDRFVAEVLQEVLALQEQDVIRVLDLLLVEKDVDGAVKSQEVSELAGNEAYNNLAKLLVSLPTDSNVEQVAEQIPPGTSAVIVVSEPRWSAKPTEAIHRAGGALLGRGLVPPDTLARLAADKGIP